jgi:mono/diheme cytochrome c family protein
MRVISAIFFLALLALAVFLMAPRKAPPEKPRRAVGVIPAASQISNALPQPPDGFYVGKGDERVYVNYASPDPVLRTFLQSIMDGSSDPNAQGKEIFSRVCAACHQRDGDGKDGVAPPLLGSEWVLTTNGNRIMRIVLNGLNGPIHVRGRDWNLSMPPWRENLNDDQIAVVLTYIRTQLGTNHAPAITPEAVAASRKQSGSTPETALHLLQVPD